MRAARGDRDVSFTAEVKDELSRVECGAVAERAELAAIVRICGTLSLSGARRFRLALTTETGSVARVAYTLLNGSKPLTCQLTVRRSVLHKTRNYLISVPDQEGLEETLIEMGVLTSQLGLAREIPAALVPDEEAAFAYLRGAFLAGGFVSEPHTADAHMEIVAQTRSIADGIASMCERVGIPARVGRRRGAFVIYHKSAEGIQEMLAALGAPRCALKMARVRAVRSARNDANRLVNAELANQKKAAAAAGSQTLLVEQVIAEVGYEKLPRALKDFCDLRLAHADLSLRELGNIADPPLSKSAVAHRVRRLEQLLAEQRANGSE